MGEISLLVFDEAHYARDNHPSNKIMQSFYHPSRLKGNLDVPHILGLTASPTFNEGLEALRYMLSDPLLLAY